ncbi:hypothetical protein HD554DRAFT_2176875 [Boletus coccyginus]|nr:hypothetical protein HD554DRAFT_2176875 [Boletus coccyginus]
MRFERLRVVDQQGVNMNELLDSAQVLKSLEFYPEPLEDLDPELTISCPLPCLRTLLLHSLDTRTTALPGATWGNLTRLAFRLPSGFGGVYHADELLGLVSRCPNLQVLTFGPFYPEHSELGELQLQLEPPSSHHSLQLLTVILSEIPAPQPTSCILILPALLRLRVQYESRYDWKDAIADMERAMDPPQPKRFFQMVVKRNEDFRMFDVGWANITHLNIVFHGDVHVFHTAIELCPNLRVLEMAGHRCSDRSTSLPVYIAYPSLCELFIAVDAPLGNILEMVTLPGLQHLTIRAVDCGEHDSFYAMLLRSRCALESLAVWERGSRWHSRTYWTDEERDKLLALLPTLTTLTLIPY